jgi:hypothetical protein
MEGQKKIRVKKEPRSRDPYRRRGEAEISEIARRIQCGELSIRGACFEYGMVRNTLKKRLIRLSVRSLDEGLSHKIFASMKEEKQVAALEQRIKELARALQTAQLKIEGLETIIRVAEKELQIKIRKKAGAKRSTK